MTLRIFAASLLGLFTGALTLLPAETAARSGVSLAGRSMPARAPARTPLLRPSGHAPVPVVHNKSVAPPLVHAPMIGSSREAAVHALRQAPRRQHVFRAGLPITILGGSAFYGTYYDPADDVTPYYQPDYQPPSVGPAIIDPTIDDPENPDQVRPVADRRHQCRMDVQIVPKDNGGQQTITIVRC